MVERIEQTKGRDRILDAAVRAMDERGYFGTSMRDVAREAQMTAPAIYHHFDSKQQLLEDIMVRVLRDHIAATRQALIAAGPDPSDQLDAMVYAFALMHAQRRADSLIGTVEMRSLEPVSRRIVVMLRDEQAELFRDVVAHGVRAGQFLTPFPVEAVRVILNMGSAISMWYHPDGELTPEEIAARYVRFAAQLVESTRRSPTAGPDA